MEPAPRRLVAVPGPDVLVADDHGPLRSVIADALRADGFEVEEAADGGTALRHLLGGRFSAAVVDVRMPVLDGLQLLERVWEEGLSCELIMMSVVADPVSRRRARQLGAAAFHQKPFPLAALVRDARRACGTGAAVGTALS